MNYCLNVGDCLQINGGDWIVAQTLEDERRICLTLYSPRPRIGGESVTLTVRKRADDGGEDD